MFDSEFWDSLELWSLLFDEEEECSREGDGYKEINENGRHIVCLGDVDNLPRHSGYSEHNQTDALTSTEKSIGQRIGSDTELYIPYHDENLGTDEAEYLTIC